MMRAIGSVLLTTALATTVTAAAAQAKFAPPLGDWGSSAPPPGKLYNRNGVTGIVVGVRDIGGDGFAPAVSWSARTTKGAAVAGRTCRIEITFPGTSFPAAHTSDCQGARGFPAKRYTVPGRYAITVADRVSGSFSTVPFVVDG